MGLSENVGLIFPMKQPFNRDNDQQKLGTMGYTTFSDKPIYEGHELSHAPGHSGSQDSLGEEIAGGLVSGGNGWKLAGKMAGNSWKVRKNQVLKRWRRRKFPEETRKISVNGEYH